MVIGHWSLVIGHWSLVIGHWSTTPTHFQLATYVNIHQFAYINCKFEQLYILSAQVQIARPDILLKINVIHQ